MTYKIASWRSKSLRQLSPLVMDFLGCLPQPQWLPCGVFALFADWATARDLAAIVPSGRFSTTFSLNGASNRELRNLPDELIGDAMIAQSERQLSLSRELTCAERGHRGERETHTLLQIGSRLPVGSFELAEGERSRVLKALERVCSSIGQTQELSCVKQCYAHLSNSEVWSYSGIRLPCENGAAALREASVAFGMDSPRLSWELLGHFDAVSFGIEHVFAEIKPGSGLAFINGFLPGACDHTPFALERTSALRPTANTTVANLPAVLALLDDVANQLAYPAIQIAPVVWTSEALERGGATGNQISILRSRGQWNVWLETRQVDDSDPAKHVARAAIEAMIATVRPSTLVECPLRGD